MPSHTFDGEFGVQFTVHIAKHYTLPEISELAQLAQDNNFDNIWVSDHLNYRHLFVILSTIASNTSIKIGPAVMPPYYRNPVDVASAAASLSEMTDGEEISMGIGRGGLFTAGYWINQTEPYRMVRETTEMLNELWAGNEVRFGDYDQLASYFNLNPGVTEQLAFTPQAPIRCYMGGFGDTSMEVCGKFMDGTVIPGLALAFLKTGRLTTILEKADQAAKESDRDKELKHVVEINTSIADDPQEARDFARTYVVHAFPMVDWSDEELKKLGVDRQTLERVQTAREEGASLHETAELVTDAMVESTFLVGTPEDCRNQLKEVKEDIIESEIDQISFAKLGPDYRKSIEALSSEIIPTIS